MNDHISKLLEIQQKYSALSTIVFSNLFLVFENEVKHNL